MAKKAKKNSTRSMKKSTRSAKKASKKSNKKAVGDFPSPLENVTIEACEAKLQQLQADYGQAKYVGNDPITHLKTEVKVAHWVRSLQNQTIN